MASVRTDMRLERGRPDWPGGIAPLPAIDPNYFSVIVSVKRLPGFPLQNGGNLRRFRAVSAHSGEASLLALRAAAYGPQPAWTSRRIPPWHSHFHPVVLNFGGSISCPETEEPRPCPKRTKLTFSSG